MLFLALLDCVSRVYNIPWSSIVHHCRRSSSVKRIFFSLRVAGQSVNWGGGGLGIHHISRLLVVVFFFFKFCKFGILI